MPKRFFFLVGSLAAIAVLLLLLFFWSNALPEAPVFQDSAPQGPIHVTIKPQLVSTNQVLIDVTITSVLRIPDLKFEVGTLPPLKVEDVPLSSFDVGPNQPPMHATVHVTGAPGNNAELISVYAHGTVNGGPSGAVTGFYLEPQNGQWQILSTNEYGRRHPAPVEGNGIQITPAPSATPKSSLPRLAPTGNVTVTGQWEYIDHAVTPTGIATTRL